MTSSKRMMDALLDNASSSDSESMEHEVHGGGSSDEECAASPAQHMAEEKSGKKAKIEITVEDLQRAGYRSGPSVRFLKPPAESGNANWDWSDGKDAKKSEPLKESAQERAATVHAVTAGVEASAAASMRASAAAALLREEARAEREERARERHLTTNQKEKKKRSLGQATRGKNYVEEEKRQARNMGVYTGFD